MRLGLAILLLISAQSVSAQARDCSNGSSEILRVTEWSAQLYDSAYSKGIKISMSIENITPNGFRMIDGTVFFDDVLGRSIVNIGIDDDAAIPAQGSFAQQGSYQVGIVGDIARLATAVSQDIKTTVCVRAAVTNDGEVLRFD